MANIRVKEAATYLGLSKSTLDKLRCYGGGPRYFKVGKAVVYSTDDLCAWIETKRQSDTWAFSNDNNIAGRARA